MCLYALIDRASDQVPLHCIDRHPTQPHIVATGGQDGSLSLWDMRQERYPVTLLTAHSSNSTCCCYAWSQQRPQMARPCPRLGEGAHLVSWQSAVSGDSTGAAEEFCELCCVHFVFGKTQTINDFVLSLHAKWRRWYCFSTKRRSEHTNECLSGVTNSFLIYAPHGYWEIHSSFCVTYFIIKGN